MRFDFLGEYGLELLVVFVVLVVGFIVWYRQIRKIETEEIPQRIMALHQLVKSTALENPDYFTELALKVSDAYGLPKSSKESLAHIMTMLSMQEAGTLSEEDAQGLFSQFFRQEQNYLFEALGAYAKDVSQIPYVSRIISTLDEFKKLSSQKDFDRVAYGQPSIYSPLEAIQFMESEGKHDPDILNALKQVVI